MKDSNCDCFKCGVKIVEKGRPIVGLYKLVAYKVNTGDILTIGFCKNCQLEPEEYKEAVEALKESLPPSITEITGYWGDEGDIAKKVNNFYHERQCDLCGKPIGDNFIITNNKIRHEVCDSKIRGHHKEDADAKGTPGREARTHRARNPRRMRGVDAMEEIKALRIKLEKQGKEIEKLKKGKDV